MSGLPVNTQTDITKFRENYMANLALRAKLDDANLQANLLFKKTGMTPVQPTDTRTTAEKVADIESVKMDVRSRLKEIADGTNASAIVQMLQTDDLQFLAQHIDAIISNIKPKYKYGVPADIFVHFLQEYIRKEQETHGVEYNLQQSTGANMLANTNAILANMASRADFEQQQRLIRDIHASTADLQKITRAQDYILQNLPTRAELKRIDDMKDINRRDELKTMLVEAMADIPTKTQISRLNDQLRLSLKDTRGEGENQNKAILEQYERQLTLIAYELAQVKKLLEEGGTDGDFIPSAEAAEVPEVVVSNFSGESAFNLYPIDERIRDYTATSAAQSVLTRWKEQYITSDELSGNTVTMIRQTIKSFRRLYIRPDSGKKLTYANFGIIKGTIDRTGKPELLQIYKNMNEYVHDVYQRVFPEWTGFRGGSVFDIPKGKMLGRGISKAIGYGIGPALKWISFGKFKIDAHKLMDNTLVLKTIIGNAVTNLPTRRISPLLADIITSLTKDTQPSLDDMYKLQDEDKRILNDLMKRSHLIGKGINVPSHDKTSDYADITKFEIMQGELGAGNDSHSLIKEYKLQILLLLKKGLLRKNEANDHLMQLALMGY